MQKPLDTITAIATPSGRGGVGIVRVSGPLAFTIAQKITRIDPKPRLAHFTDFMDQYDTIIDSGLVIYFQGPNSFTGEDVLELQGHGGLVVMDMLLRTVLSHGARLARPGEFSERAFLNHKMDLAQAEAVADLINAASTEAARSATRSLQGEFSKKIHAMVEALIHLRIYVEASIDFPEEEINFLSDGKIARDLQTIIDQLSLVKNSAKQGVLLQEGLKVVIAGKPNAGKSSLLNCLSGRDSAIVTDIEGTTRDVLREHIHIDGLPLHIIDTAGLRESNDIIEQEGIKRAWDEIRNADAIMLIIDVTRKEHHALDHYEELLALRKPVLTVWNKIDLFIDPPTLTLTPQAGEGIIVNISTKTGAGIDTLKQALKNSVQYENNGEGTFIARRRHLDAIERANDFLLKGQHQLLEHKAGELLAEDLRKAQEALSEITGEFTSDDLLGRIFSSFCIGK
jgi:tRNA modification GTPase